MTLVVGCHFLEGAVVLADSRATWQSPGGKNVFQDTLQKILPLLPTATIAYAGDVSTATSLINSLSKRIQENNRLKNIGYLGPNLGRFAKHDYQTLQGLNRNPQPVSLILSGIDVGRSQTGAGSHEVGLWAYSSPRFHLTEVKHSFVAIGSGANIAIPFLKKHWSEIVSLAGGLQEKANWLFPRLESELENGTDLFVGGLFQILLIEPAGIRPLNYWRLTLDPDSDVDPISMSMSKGVWTQSNLRSGSNIAVKKPSSLLRGSPRSIEVRTYPGPQRPTRHYPESFLTYFVLCMQATPRIGSVVFSGTMNCFAAGEFPTCIPLLACFAIHPEIGTHTVTIRFGRDRSRMVFAYNESIECTFPLEEIKRTPRVDLPIESEGEYYVELWIDDYRLARKPILAMPYTAEVRAAKEPSPDLLEAQRICLLENQSTRIDPELQKGEIFLSYFVPCRRAEISDGMTAFHEIGNVYFPSAFPASTRYFLATGFRAKTGTYRVRVLLTETSTRNTVPITTATVEATHDFRDIDLRGEITLPFPHQGVYVLDQYVEDKRIARTHFMADDVNNPMSYSLMDEDIQKIKNGESLMLLRDSVNINSLTPEERTRI